MPFDSAAIPIEVPELAPLTQELFAAYLQASNLTGELYDKIAGFLSDVTPNSPTVDLYQLARGLNPDSSTIDPETIRTINSYLHLTSVAHEVRRQTVRRFLSQRTQVEVEARQHALKPVDEPLPYNSYVGGGWIEWLFPTIDRYGQNRDPLVNSPEELIALIRQISPEKVFTQHPTNSNTVELNRSVAEAVAAGLEITCPASAMTSDFEIAQRFTAALQRFHNAQRIPEKNFSVSNEVDLSNNATINFLKGRKESFEELVALARVRFGDSLSPELLIQIADAYYAGLVDWAGADKDNNDSVKFEHRLAKLVEQRFMMVNYYQNNLLELMEAGCQDGFIAIRFEQLQQIIEKLEVLQKEINQNKQPDGDIILSRNEAHRISQAINEACTARTGKDYRELATAMIGELEEAFMAAPQGKKSYKYLSFVSDLKNSGFYGYHNELRENCEFYEEVFNEVLLFMPYSPDIQDFHKKPIEEQLTIIDRLSELRTELRAATDKLIASVDPKEAKSRIYENNPRIKAYHTLQSLKLTQDHRDCFKNLVLAETENPKNVLIVLALQAATQNPENEHWLNVIILAESRESLRRIVGILKKLLRYKSFRQLMVKVGGCLEVMLAYSDSWRVLGRIAADGFLAAVRTGKNSLNQLQDLSVTWSGITVFLKIRRYDGLSVSDSSRGGGVDQISNITDGIPKHLIQGVDQANHYNSPASSQRVIVKDMTRAAKVVKGRVTKTDVELEMIISDAASRTHSIFKTRHFEKSMLRMLGHPLFNYALNALISNFSSRKASRGKNGGNPWAKGIQFVNLKISRAISVSITLFYANIVNNWYVADVFESNLAKKIAGDVKFQKKISEAGEKLFGMKANLLSDDTHISAFTAQTLYSISVEYRHHLDKITQGVALTNLGVNHARQALASTKGVSESALAAKDERALFKEYYSAVRLGSISFTGQEPPEAMESPSLEGCSRLHDYVQKKVLPMEDRDYLERLSLLPLAIHDQLIIDQIIASSSAEPSRSEAETVALLRINDNGFNRVRNPLLGVHDIAEDGHVRKAVRPECPVPDFGSHVALALAA